MLIDFTVENYRSIKEPVKLSAVAKSGKISKQGRKEFGRGYVKPDQSIAPVLPVAGRGFELLPSLGIFGANASGKSNVLMALDKLLDLMANQTVDVRSFDYDTFTGISPFGLSEVTASSPTRFRIRIAIENAVYTYSLSLDRQRITDERLELLGSTARRSSSLFIREWDQHANQYKWKIGQEFGVYQSLQGSIKERETFLGLLTTRLNVEALRDFSSWTNIRWIGLGHEGFNHLVSVQQLTRMGQSWRSRVVELIRRFDTGLSDIEVGTKQLGDAEPRMIAVHNHGGRSVRWPFEEESTGTQRLFDLANKVLSCLDHGNLILEDELGSSVHPSITREIVRLFQSPTTNPKRAQLIFTSHDNTLQQRNLLRRDQIWFTQKREDGSTELYPLTDFKPRNDLAIDKSYLDGRFGAVPFLPDTEDLLPVIEALDGMEQETVA